MPDRFRRGDAIRVPAAEYNALAAALEQDYGLTAAGGLLLQRGPTGRALALPKDPCTYATLSGTTSPYSWTEAYPQSGGTFAAGVRTGATNAYEANATASLAGKVVRICPGYPGDWRFYTRPRSCPNTITFTVSGCSGSGVQGATVTITQGASSVSGTTNSSGQVTLTPTASGTWGYTVSKAPRWADKTGTLAFTCGGGNSSLTVFPVAATGYVCCQLCIDPLSQTLHVNDGVGTVSLAYNASASTLTDTVWTACVTRSASAVYSASGCTTNTGAGTVNVYFQVDCGTTSNGGMRLQVSPANCSPDGGFTTHLSNGGCPGANNLNLLTASAGGTCSPLAYTYTKTWASPYTLIYPGTPQSYSLSE